MATKTYAGAAATIFVPTGAPSPRPLVIVSPGFQLARTQYTSYARHLATWGMSVVLADYADTAFFPNHANLATDVKAVIDAALADQTLAADPTKLALAGHSLGGKISVLVATSDARVAAIVAWDPVDSNTPSVAPELMAGLTAKLAVIGETTNATGGFMPCAPADDNFTTFYAAAATPALQLTVTGADHMDWVDDPSCTFCGACTAGTAAPEVTRSATRRLTVAWLRRHLENDTAMEPWLAAPTGTTLLRK